MLPKTATDLNQLLLDPRYVAQQKYDGQRLLVQVLDGEATAFNRKGDEMVMPVALARCFDHPAFTDKWIFDGELVDGVYHIFDILMIRLYDITGQTWVERHRLLTRLQANWSPERSLVRIVDTAWDGLKFLLCEEVIENGFEGVVFKHIESTYKPGKQNEWLKHKITKTCDAIVTELNRKGKDQAVTVSLYNEQGELQEVAGLKIPMDLVGEIPLDSVVEVRYLYPTAEGKLYQPVFLGIRHDKTMYECTTDQVEG